MISIHQLHKMNTYIDVTWTLASENALFFPPTHQYPVYFFHFGHILTFLAQINPQGVFPANSLNTMIGKIYRNG